MLKIIEMFVRHLLNSFSLHQCSPHSEIMLQIIIVNHKGPEWLSQAQQIIALINKIYEMLTPSTLL